MGKIAPEKGGLREKFWERPLEQLNRAEWEALCDGCGRCCLHKVEDVDTGAIYDTNVACKLLDCSTGLCTNYRHRKALVPDCLRLTITNVYHLPWLPETCAYRRRAENRELPEWHYLLTGDRLAVRAAGVSVHERVISEIDAGPLEHHMVDWDDDHEGGDAGENP